LTLVVGGFSRTYLHREPGFLRFFVLLSLFASGTQLVAWAGALDVMFAGWELMGWSSALYIGFFCERREPVRSSLRAFTTYRMCDIGFLLAMVATHEFVGSTRLAELALESVVAPAATPLIAAMFVLAALGKSAQLPFSGWLPRAMEGPTPSSALFYGGISIHAGLYLVLRVWPVVAASPVVTAATAVIGVLTALYATAVARVHPDAKGALAHATLAQVGLILAEIALGFTTLALFHILGHASLRVWQYLRAPNTIHDAHRLGHYAAPAFLGSAPPGLAARAYLAALHRLRLDERIDALLSPVLLLARLLDRVDAAYRRKATLDRPVSEDQR
jgi:NADH-quinone oxidoreductase subunit L